jgi:hypothetical protein
MAWANTTKARHVTVLIGEGRNDEFMPLECQSCENFVLGGGFCLACKAGGACSCEYCQQPIQKTRVVNLGEEDSTKRGSRCGKCRVVVYCDKACQKRDWKQHKKQCTGVDMRTVSSASRCSQAAAGGAAEGGAAEGGAAEGGAAEDSTPGLDMLFCHGKKEKKKGRRKK